ncbi:uncharacterized protein J7T54_001672 [Emericellopsis cladophorae]|uniref:Uncharacterized protein n=1 Tax=Emericellopsis cladophorae TaxID=2686198 RepID=A0A9P9Y5H7_9HYPO|nr:uncharacterized protein J7T54_001672 [Emericellopsis cladophorae]KAI6783796.1 hypothetical protein J7T54_001672 [Emericellopsis cladophorae]
MGCTTFSPPSLPSAIVRILNEPVLPPEIGHQHTYATFDPERSSTLCNTDIWECGDEEKNSGLNTVISDGLIWTEDAGRQSTVTSTVYEPWDALPSECSCPIVLSTLTVTRTETETETPASTPTGVEQPDADSSGSTTAPIPGVASFIGAAVRSVRGMWLGAWMGFCR